MEKLNDNILYLSFHNSIKKIYGVNKFVEIEKIRIKLGRQYLVPKRFRDKAILELENMGLIKVEEKYVKVLDKDLDLENCHLQIKQNIYKV